MRKPTTKKLSAFLKLSKREQWLALAAFCAAQPASKEYDYTSVINCPKAQFANSLVEKSKYLTDATVGADVWIGKLGDLPIYKFLHSDEILGIEECLKRFPRTFGGLTERFNEFFAKN